MFASRRRESAVPPMLSREARRGAGRGVRGAPTHATRGTPQAELGCRSLTTQSAAQGPREGVEVRHHGDVTLGETPGQRLDLGNRLPPGDTGDVRETCGCHDRRCSWHHVGGARDAAQPECPGRPPTEGNQHLSVSSAEGTDPAPEHPHSGMSRAWDAVTSSSAPQVQGEVGPTQSREAGPDAVAS